MAGLNALEVGALIKQDRQVLFGRLLTTFAGGAASVVTGIRFDIASFAVVFQLLLYCAFGEGLYSGLSCGAITFALYLHSQSTEFLRYTSNDLTRVMMSRFVVQQAAYMQVEVRRIYADEGASTSEDPWYVSADRSSAAVDRCNDASVRR